MHQPELLLGGGFGHVHVGRLKVARGDELAVERFGMPAERICFLSSNAWDVAGAADFGLTVVWVNRFGQPPERLPGSPVAEIQTLDALPRLLGVA